jgi:hypothetical protein
MLLPGWTAAADNTSGHVTHESGGAFVSLIQGSGDFARRCGSTMPVESLRKVVAVMLTGFLPLPGATPGCLLLLCSADSGLNSAILIERRFMLVHTCLHDQAQHAQITGSDLQVLQLQALQLYSAGCIPLDIMAQCDTWHVHSTGTININNAALTIPSTHQAIRPPHSTARLALNRIPNSNKGPRRV